MEQENKKRRTGQNIAFYTALAVCLIAVGVGTWELLQPERSGSGTAAVSSAVALPGDGGAAEARAEAAPEAGSVAEAAPEAGSVAGASAEGVAEEAQAVSGAAAVPQEAAAKADVKAKESGAKAEQSGAKAKESAAKNSKESEPAKADAKAKESKTDAKATESKPDAKAAKGKLTGEAVRPVEGETVTGFSMDKLLYNETMRDWRTHDGIDIAAGTGTAVVAARAGTVESVTADPIMGTTVVIRHEDKWESVYASLADMAEVEAGDEVIAGQVIGFVGETAASESALGPHLHFSALNDGVPADPEAFLA